MKRLLIALLLCLCPAMVMAAPGWERSITAEWGYDAPADLVLTGFRMYQEGVAVFVLHPASIIIAQHPINVFFITYP